MKRYSFKALKYLKSKTVVFRERYDILMHLLSVMQFLNIEPLEKVSCQREDADIVLVVDKMSRLFWGIEDKIHSIQYPFLLKESNESLLTLFEEQIIDSQTITILFAILGEKMFIYKSIDNMLDSFMDTMNDFGIRDNGYVQFCWSLLLHLLTFETGYLRYDHDEDPGRIDDRRHPIDHLDFFYSGNNTFKIGLKDRIGVNDLKKIVDINEKCCFLDIR